MIRVYQKDSQKQTHFIGEQRLGSIPEDEKVVLKIGNLFDVVGEKTITQYKARKNYRNVETTYALRNQGKETVTLKLKEQLPVYGDKINVKTSCNDRCTVEKKNAFLREYTITLKSKEHYDLTSEFEVHF